MKRTWILRQPAVVLILSVLSLASAHAASTVPTQVTVTSVDPAAIQLEAGKAPVTATLKGTNLTRVTEAQVIQGSQTVTQITVQLASGSSSSRPAVLQAASGTTPGSYQLRLIGGGQQLDLPLSVVTVTVKAGAAPPSSSLTSAVPPAPKVQPAVPGIGPGGPKNDGQIVNVTTTPASGLWHTGTPVQVQWQWPGYQNFPADVTLQRGTQVTAIVSGWSGLSVGWNVPYNLTPGSYRVRVQSSSNPGNFSEATVQVELCTVAVTSPAPADAFGTSSAIPIGWTFTGGNPGPLKLELLPAAGGTGQLIADNVPWGNSGVGQYSWKVPGNVNPGHYTIRITSMGNSVITATGQPFSLGSFATALIRVGDDKNAAVGGATVTVTVNGAARSAITGGNGQALFDSLPPGTYTFKAAKSGYYAPGAAETTLTLASGAPQSALITLAPSLATLAVTLKDGGAPIQGMWVMISGQVNLDVGTEPDGTATFKDVPEGTYSVWANPYTYNDTHQIKYGEVRTNVTLTRGAPVTQTVSLQRFGTATMTVTDAMNIPVYGAAVCTTSGMRVCPRETSDINGKLTVALPGGAQTLEVWATGYETGHPSITIPSGGTTTGAITLIKR